MNDYSKGYLSAVANLYRMHYKDEAKELLLEYGFNEIILDELDFYERDVIYEMSVKYTLGIKIS